MGSLHARCAYTAFWLFTFLLCAASAPAAVPLYPIRVGYTSVGGNRAPLWIAKDENIFNKYGLDAELVYIPGATTAVPALLSNNLQILAGSAATTLQAVSQGAKLVVFGTFGPTPYILFTRPEIKTIGRKNSVSDCHGLASGLGPPLKGK
jgi:ABC-type nitrate/sulfonate/bicarbonate transport system substrate-binding protein